jgi:23S rRNA pseudouridine2604 synthase
MEKTYRINQYLAQKGYATRRGADALIAAGKVRVNGRIAIVGEKVTDKEEVTVQSKKPLKEYTYLAYHKPVGIVTNAPAPHEKDISMALHLDPSRNLQPIGRLDKDSSGLIILTNDTRIVGPLLTPHTGHEKEYLVTVQEPLKRDFEKQMSSGVCIGTYTTRPCAVAVRGRNQFSIVLTEGKNRQIRRMCAALGYTVTALVRVRIMHLTLGTLRPNQFRVIRDKELTELLSLVGTPQA